MIKLRYSIRKDWLFYLVVIGYVYLIINMTIPLWFGDGVNIFATYSDAATIADITADANKVYWSKTSYLFLILLLHSLNFDFRFVAGVGSTFWSSSLILMFGPNPTLISVLILGILLIVQQIWRKHVFYKPSTHF